MPNEPETGVGPLIEQAKEGNRQALQYSRSRFLMTWLGIALLALMTAFALIVAIRASATNLEQTDDIARVANTTADEAQADTDDITAYLRGEQGIPGVPGADGQDGQPGLPSSEPGPEGPPGQPGETGPSGSTGNAGIAGPQGPTGAFGSIGPVGPTGATGEKGDKGDEGARGAEGSAGPPGPEGPQGPPGTPPPFQVSTSVVFAASPNTPDDDKQISVQCTEGRVSGGGYATVPNDPGIINTASAPNGNGWNATSTELSLPVATNWQLLVFAICVT